MTWYEIFSLSDATDVLKDQKEGVTGNALDKFAEFNAKVRNG